MSSDLDVVARAIYHVFSQPITGQKPWFDQLPLDAKEFLRDQARAGLERLRDQVSDGAIEAGYLKLSESGITEHPLDADRLLVRDIFMAIMDRVLAGKPN